MERKLIYIIYNKKRSTKKKNAINSLISNTKNNGNQKKIDEKHKKNKKNYKCRRTSLTFRYISNNITNKFKKKDQIITDKNNKEIVVSGEMKEVLQKKTKQGV